MSASRAPSRRSHWLALAAATGFAGCIVVAPIEDLPEPAPGVGGAGGSGASAGRSSTSGASGGGQAGTSPAGQGGEAGDEAGGSSGQGGAPSAGATGTSGGASGSGGDGDAGCATNRECVELGAGEPYRCRESDGRCVALRSNECPLVYGEYQASEPLYFGSFATLNRSQPQINSVVWAERLALDEINRAGGIPGGPDGVARPLVMVVCNNDDLLDGDVVDRGMLHLAEEVEAQALLATLKPEDLLRAFETHQVRDLFYLSPVALTSALTDPRYEDDDLIWNLLGQPFDFADAYAVLLTHLEAHVRRERNLPDPLANPLKVALISGEDPFNDELANYLFPRLVWNGKSVSLNDDEGNFLSETLALEAPDLQAAAQRVLDFAPDIVISTAAEAVTMDDGIVELLETAWEGPGGRGARPYYILSPYNAGDLGIVQDYILAAVTEPHIIDPDAAGRFLGVSAASAPDPELRNGFQERLLRAFEGQNPILDTGNYYDAVYFLSYASFAGLTSGRPTGPDTAAGMHRLLAGDRVDVGPDSIDAVFERLADPEVSVSLHGTLGGPDFDPETGVRRATPSVFCFEALQALVLLHSDVLRFERDQRRFTGTYPCLEDFLAPE